MNVARAWPLLPILIPWTALLLSPPAAAQAPPLPAGDPVPLLQPAPGEPTFSARVRPDPETGWLSALWRIGEEAFDLFVERYMTGGVVRTEGLLQILGEVAGSEAAELLRQELAAGPDR